MVTIRIFSGFPQYYKTLYSKNPSRKWKEEFSPTSYAGGWDSNKIKSPLSSRTTGLLDNNKYITKQKTLDFIKS